LASIGFWIKKTVHRIKRYEEKTKSYDYFLKNPKILTEFLQIGLSWSKHYFLKNPKILTEFLQIGLSWSKLIRFAYFFYENTQN